MKKICVVGLGYVGLPMSVLFAKNGFIVNGFDTNEEIVSNINQGNLMIKEPSIEEDFYSVINTGSLKAFTKPIVSDIYIITVPTPINPNDLTADMKYVISAAKSIAPIIKKGDLILLDSTIPVGTTRNVFLPLLNINLEIGEEIFIAHAPERIFPGNAKEELINNSKVIGAYSHNCFIKAKEVYQHFVKGNIAETSLETAEFVKLIENSFRDVNIAFANELIKISEKNSHIDIYKAIEIANEHPRVNILQPGPGVGGHCIAVDPYFLIESFPSETSMISIARNINTSMPNFVYKKIVDISAKYKKRKITIVGIAYKDNIDDYRESPALEIINLIQNNKNLELTVYDKIIQKKIVDHQVFSYKEAIINSDIIVCLNNHEGTKQEILSLGKEKLKEKILFDTRNIFKETEEQNKKFFRYVNLSTNI